MKESPSQRKSGLFWVGVTLLSLSAIFWLFLAFGIVSIEGDGDIVLSGVIFTAIPIGIGIYCVWRGRKAPAVEAQRGPEHAAKPVREPQRSVGLIKDTESGIVLRRPVWFYVVGWLFGLAGAFLVFVSLAIIISGDPELIFLLGISLGLLLLGIWFAGWTTRVTLDQAVGYITVTRGHCPLFLWFLRTRIISRDEARSVSICSEEDKYFSIMTGYEVIVRMSSGKALKIYDGWNSDRANYLVKRIREFARETG